MNQPVGPAVDTTPAERPGTATLSGRFCRIEPLDPVRHGEDLWREFASDETLWTYFSNGPFANERGFAEWLERRAALADPFSYVVVYLNDGRSAGYFALLEIRPTMRVIEIGSIVYGPVLQRTPAATEAQYLMARYAFETLRYRRYEWKCDALNAKSRRAALRLGFTFEGIFRQHRIVKGRNRDSAWLAILDGEWAARKRAFERWLAPENFDAAGRQLVSLSSLNGREVEAAQRSGRIEVHVGRKAGPDCLSSALPEARSMRAIYRRRVYKVGQAGSSDGGSAWSAS